MADEPIFQLVLEVAPSPRGEGVRMVLLWDGRDRAITVAHFDGQEVTADIGPERLLAEVRELQELACEGRLQVVFRSDVLIAQLNALSAPR